MGALKWLPFTFYYLRIDTTSWYDYNMSVPTKGVIMARHVFTPKYSLPTTSSDEDIGYQGVHLVNSLVYRAINFQMGLFKSEGSHFRQIVTLIDELENAQFDFTEGSPERDELVYWEIEVLDPIANWLEVLEAESFTYEQRVQLMKESPFLKDFSQYLYKMHLSSKSTLLGGE